MVKLKDIINKASKASTSLIKSSPIKTSLSAVITQRIDTELVTSSLFSGSDSSKREKFAEQAAQIVTEEKFLDELEESIGKPHQNESENAFVNRAKRRMREMLRAKLK
ncbi:hypothetical protein CWC46_14260 [Prodigiosinella confusarubida]|uniref:Uncharacterized protein n=1 Tax=Serratia sp. (strain ATCC 39006) TaxID=104623 RepID=A0A2I5TKU9_SERS3|nr:hypothetical protein [Serratia sp. ATCC 39006]AUH00869.1 hypothetical protein CWC46_14260 [Serratia sp. ATCC 39006]AUH05191.1 hypothetical protein Ser39006_014265 [Serratia sp. ATCC 39006]